MMPLHKLYSQTPIEYGRNLPYSPLVFISVIILFFKFSYSSFPYCLFRMQYFFLRKPTHPKQYSTSSQISRYSEYRALDQEELVIWYPPYTQEFAPETSSCQVPS